MGGIWGQTRNLDDRTLDPVDLSRRGSGGHSRAGRPDMGTDTMSDIPVRNVQRPTLNVQWGERKGAWWAGYGTDTELRRYL